MRLRVVAIPGLALMMVVLVVAGALVGFGHTGTTSAHRTAATTQATTPPPPPTRPRTTTTHPAAPAVTTTTAQIATTTASTAPHPRVAPAKAVTRPRHPSSFVVADATVPAVALFSSPEVPLAGRPLLVNPTAEGLPVVFLAKEERGPWLRVQVAVRPNGMEAWVRTDEVRLRRVPNWIRVELGARKATVFHEDAAVFQTTVAVGRSTAPTPTGNFFVDGVVLLADQGGPYGVGQMSVSAFSDVYQQFGGGVGQIALHGTNAPGLLGQGVSHGCVRFDNPALTRVMELAPTGTPVEIIA